MARVFFPFARRSRASRVNEKGRALQNEGKIPEAIAAFRKAAEIDPGWSVPCYNLGLVFKYEFDWLQSFDWCLKATQLDASDRPGWWNLGIAATALERWDKAREAWTTLGIAIPDGEGPVEFPCGSNPIRLNPTGAAEVVWCQRIDPARAAIKNIPLPESGFCWGDILLNDGAASGTRMSRGTEVPVFDCLGLLQASPYLTFTADVMLNNAETDLKILAELVAGKDLATEDWTTELVLLCKACSEGRAHDQHDEPTPVPDGHHRIAIAARTPEVARSLLDEWQHHSDGILINSLIQPRPER